MYALVFPSIWSSAFLRRNSRSALAIYSRAVAKQDNNTYVKQSNARREKSFVRTLQAPRDSVAEGWALNSPVHPSQLHCVAGRAFGLTGAHQSGAKIAFV